MADLELTLDGAVATLTMNRPEARNALSMEMRQGMDEAFHQVEFDASIRCVVLTGAGEHFMAGGDVKKLHAHSTRLVHAGFGLGTWTGGFPGTRKRISSMA